LADSHSVADTVPARQYLSFQFEDLDQQRSSATLGMWIFLATEVLFFGALFTGYFIYRAIYPQAFADASRAMLIQFGTANTFILICSSLTMALGVHAAQVGARKMLVVMLIITMLFGTAFLVNKGFEYHQEWKEHHVPGPGYEFPESRDPRHAEIFFSLYFIMTGIHTVHLIIGIGVVGVIAFFAWKGHYPPQYHTPVENVGLYWHFVDIVWVFLYPMLYLVAHRHIS
jgi:cytochrome c oxidase subunit III